MNTKKIEQFLEDFANLKPQDTAAAERFLRVYGGAMFPPSFPAEVESREHELDLVLESQLKDAMPDIVNTQERTPAEIREVIHMYIWGLASQLRKIWDEPNLDDKSWYIDELRRWFYQRTEPSRSALVPAPPPSRSGFQLALLYLKNNADRAQHCKNPECVEQPYYFTEHRNSRYCSLKCADWAKKEARRRYERKPKGKGRS